MPYALRPTQVDFASTWLRLNETVEKVISLNSVDRLVWDHCFSDIYSLCVAIPDPLSERLYNKTKECLEKHVRNLYEDVKSVENSDLLAAYFRAWNVYHKGATIIHSLFGYLNKQFIKSRRQIDSEMQYGPLALSPDRDNQMLEIGELALLTWRQLMISPLESELLQQLLEAIGSDRTGRDCPVPVETIRGVILSFVQVEEYSTNLAVAVAIVGRANSPNERLNVYCEIFEDAFLKTTSEYYEKEAARLLAENTCSKYMEEVIQRIDDENLRARKFLHSSSYEKVTGMCQEVMVVTHREKLYAVSRDIIRQEMSHDLRNMYALLKPVSNGLRVLIGEFESYAKKTALEAVQNLRGGTENVQNQFVDSLLLVFNKFSRMVLELFGDDGDFNNALDKALQSAVNYKEESKSCPKASEWVARYTDTLLRKSVKGLSEEEVDGKLSMAIVIFRYIEDKDIFQKFYSRMLAQRLIHGVSVSMDAEEAMINKLKQACGYEFTSKLSRMLTDVKLSRDLTEKFVKDCGEKSLNGDNGLLDVQMQILVLQAGAWPLSNSQTPLSLPTELQPSVELFNQFYAHSHNGRKLTWLFNMASAEVRLNYLDKIYLVTMSVPQLAILLCFANQDSVPFAELEYSTQLVPDTLGRVLRTIVDTGLLVCDAKDSMYTPETLVNLNKSFVSKRLRFKITAPVIQKQVDKETEQVHATISQDRKYYMECTIVRIMKTRKVLKHNALLKEVIDQTKARFMPDMNFIKKNIEALIDKQYIQRTDQHDEYQYLA